MYIPTIQQRRITIRNFVHYDIECESIEDLDSVESSAYIERILCRFPLDALWLREIPMDRYIERDGDVKAAIIKAFLSDKFSLEDLSMLHFDGMMFRDMPKVLQLRILDTELVLNIIPKSVDDDYVNRIMTIVKCC